MMMEGHGMMMMGMGVVWLLTIVALILGIAALILVRGQFAVAQVRVMAQERFAVDEGDVQRRLRSDGHLGFDYRAESQKNEKSEVEFSGEQGTDPAFRCGHTTRLGHVAKRGRPGRLFSSIH